MKSGRKTTIKAKAIQAINRRGALLVYPLDNRKEPASIWSELYPRSKMRWEWDQGGDTRVSDLWILREELSRSRKVIYSKWYQGRATFLSEEVFTDLLSYLRPNELALTVESQQMLDILTSDSPLSTKQLKAAVELEGRLLEPLFNRTIKPLWRGLLLVGFGEFEDSSFPSLGIGATQTLFEDLWLRSLDVSPDEATARLERRLGKDNPFLKFARRVKNPSR